MGRSVATVCDCDFSIDALSPSSWITVSKPRQSVQKISSTEMSNEMLVTASHVPGSRPTRSSMPAKKFATLRCSIMTPFGRPVEPDVKMT